MEDRNPEKKILKRLQEEDLRPFYIIYGFERYFIRRSVEMIEKKILLQGGTKECSIFRYYGHEVKIEEIIDMAQTAPFFGERRLILLVDADDMKDKPIERLCAYLRNPCLSTCLLLVCGAKFPKGNFFKSLRSQDKEACLEFPKLNKVSLNFWIHEIAKGKGIHLNPSLVEHVIDVTGNDLEAINIQLDKISLFFEGRSDAQDTEMDHLLNFTREEQLYQLTDALLRGSVQEALRSLTRILDQGYPPLVVLSGLCRETRIIWNIHETILKGGSVESLCEELRVPDFKIKKYVKTAKQYTGDRLHKVVHHFLQTDRALKSSRLHPRNHLERLVLGLCMPMDKNYIVQFSAR